MSILSLLTSSISLGLHAAAFFLIFALTLVLLTIPTLLICKSGFILPISTTTTSPSQPKGVAGEILVLVAMALLLSAHIITMALVLETQGGLVSANIKSGIVIGTALVVFLGVRLVAEALIRGLAADLVVPARRAPSIAVEEGKTEPQ